MTRLSWDVLKQIWPYISAVTGALAKWPSILKKFPFLTKIWVRATLGAVACCSLGFYAGYLNYERQWVLTDRVEGPLFKFPGKQAPGETWSQWMMDPQQYTKSQAKNLSIQMLKHSDFLYDGIVRPPVVGILSGQDSISHGLHGRTAIAIPKYQIGRFWRFSTARLTVKVSRYEGFPPRISVFVNENPIGEINPADQSLEYRDITFPSRYLDPYNNHIYLEPDYADPRLGSRLMYVDSIQIETY